MSDMYHLQSERVENVFDTADDIDQASARMSHDSIYMRPNLARRNTSRELTKQLSELQRTVSAQGELLKRLVDELNGVPRPDSGTSAQQNDIGMALNRNRG